METRCRCGTEVRYTFDHLGCIQCGAACCPACSYELESASYCPNCAEALLDLPWAAAANPARTAAGIA
jgi:hypothetical protein